MKKHLLFPFVLASFMSAESGLTIYNQGVAVIRETVPLDLKVGKTSISFARATAQVQPDSVVLRDPAGKVSFSVLEQGYRNDPVSQSLLLQHFEGKTIQFQKSNQAGETFTVPGKIIRSGHVAGGRSQMPIIEVGGQLQFSLPGLPLFPALGDDSILRPTLNWQIGSAEAAQFDAQLSYLSNGLSWNATYNIVAPEKGERVTINGWVTLSNHSGTMFRDAKVKLVAGNVNVQQPPVSRRAMMMKSEADPFAMGDARVREKSFDDFHLYTLPRPLDLRDRETKQVEFLSSAKVQAQKKYLYAPFRQRFHGRWNRNPLDSEFGRDVLTYWEFENSEKNGLGVPFPEGKMRFYRNDEADGNLEFVGENIIKHTPKNELISVQTGTAFDLIGDRKIRNFDAKTLGPNRIRETVEITLTNRSQSQKTITVREPLWRWSNWKIEKPSHDFTQIDSNTVEFKVTVPADSQNSLAYTALYFEK